ncbi:hypothetical protein PPUJ20028_32870 [Pseudomonas putida]|uniref:Uncharacterized protein n=1 Tax=Pseudomonas putida TaxID=303 RepID=A0AA37RE78_PSEPU|nr:hypothetical protein [Pseudomonas putida]GLO14704.1 hypothetical protein PPUJ20028_32870 [Pseudomonas putida]GLO34929.1 hypothetical protein PPUN14671_17620 [Pseudomonas putida]HDS0963588.1 hypothetical protein [Pseudomonas putida]HDS0988847.1 hypothetical protein [Pseudomonas putida]
MDEIENPIKELFDLLELMLQHNSADSCLNVWAKALKFSNSNTHDAITALAEVLSLIERCKVAAQHIPGDKDLFLQPLSRVQEMMKNQNISNAWQNSAAYLDGATMTGLKYGIYAINQFYPGAQPEKSSSIRDYVKRIDDLLEEFLSSDLPDEVKNLFAKHLHALSAALTSMRVNGTETIEETLDAIYGSLYRRSDSIKEASPGNEGIICRFMEMLGHANELVSGWQNATALVAYTSPMLLPLIKTVT